MTRLEAIFSLLELCDTFIDVGTDHGYIAEFMTERAVKVIAADISDKCLSKAKNLLAKRKNVEFVVSDGLKMIETKCDEIALCGMGGHTIIEILFSPKIKVWQPVLVIQPQNDVPLVRKFLYNNCYTITNDITVFENNKYYDVLKAKFGAESLTESEIKYGKFYKNKDKILLERLKNELQKLKSFKSTVQNLNKLNEIEEILKNWQK